MFTQTFIDPSLTEYEIEKQKLIGKTSTTVEQQPDDAKKITAVVNQYKDSDHHDE